MTTDRGHVHRVTISLRYRDVDEFGHLNQSLYHVFLEEARAGLVYELLPGPRLIGYVLARVELDHRREVRRDAGTVDVEAWVVAVGTSSLRIGSRVLLPDGTIAAEGVTVLVGWDHETRGSRRIADDERTVLEAAIGSPS
jgi:acyl-CoA thioester hydrolase